MEAVLTGHHALVIIMCEAATPPPKIPGLVEAPLGTTQREHDVSAVSGVECLGLR